MYIISVIFAQGFTIQSSQAVSNAKKIGWPLTEVGEALYLTEAPGGYRFYLLDKDQPDCGKCDELLSVTGNELQMF